MLGYQIVWLVAVVGALASGIAVIGLGCYLLRRVVEDSSNSTEWRTFLVRGFRVLPGVALIVFGCALLLIVVVRIASLRVPAPMPLATSGSTSISEPSRPMHVAIGSERAL
jgi:hypothetical protein